MEKKALLFLPGLLAVLGLLLALFLNLRNSVPSGEDSLKVGVTVYKGEDTFLSAMTTALRESATAYEAEHGLRVTLSVGDAQESQRTQNGQVERFLSLGYHVLCVNLVDRTDAGPIIDKAREAGVPVVFFNREPVSEDLARWDKVYYVGSDARQSAREQANIILNCWLENPQSIDRNGDGVVTYIMLEGESRHQDSVIRTEASVQALKEADMVLERLDGGIANWDRSQASALMEGFLSRHGEQIELVIANNDDMALGAMDAVARAGLSVPNIVGIDGTPQGIQAVDEGKLLGTVVMDVTAHGTLLFDLAQSLARGEVPQPQPPLSADRIARIPMYPYTKNG